MFEGNTINSTHINDYLLLIIVACSIIVLRAYYMNPKAFVRILYSPLNLNQSEKLLKDSNIITTRTSFFLNIVFIVGLSIFCFLTLDVFDLELHIIMNIDNKMIFLSVIFGVLIMYYLLRYIIYSFTGRVSKNVSLQKHYIQLWLSLHKFYGLILLPVLLGLLYLPENSKPYIVYILAGLLALMYLYKLLQGFKIATAKGVSFLVIFFYLCTLELLPVSVLIKFMSDIIR
jgi:hypothetical protein